MMGQLFDDPACRTAREVLRIAPTAAVARQKRMTVDNEDYYLYIEVLIGSGPINTGVARFYRVQIVETPQPVILSLQVTNGNAVITWASVPNASR